MGFFFQLQDANIVAYLTDRRRVDPPRLERWPLSRFLGALSHGGHSRQFAGDRGRPEFVSSKSEWVEQIKNASFEAYAALGRLPAEEHGSYLDPIFVAHTLAELRRYLSDYDLFGLTVHEGYRTEGDVALDAFALHAAYSSGHRALFLITENENASQPIDFLDPFPVLGALAEGRGSRPGMLLWTSSGVAAYAPLADAEILYGELLKALRAGSQKSLSDILREYRGGNRSKRILHLSDLHLGTQQAAENQELLLQHLEQVVPTIDRIVITGDLFDEPKRSYSTQYKNFSYALRRLSDKVPVVVPGNHDQKRWGNVGADFSQLIELEWKKVVVDDDMQAVMFCFDSSRDANLARGKVSKDQRRDVAVEYEAQANKRDELRKYLNLSLVHHHPFSFEADEHSLLNRGLKLVGKSDEDFLRMEDGEEFVDWCARRSISLILHGHKHIPRHVCKSVEVASADGVSYREVTAIGCGTSLGAEGKPLSYNIVNWDHDSQRWAASYFADPGDGGGFVGRKLAVASI